MENKQAKKKEKAISCRSEDMWILGWSDLAYEKHV